MLKNSFTLFETILSITILLIVIIGFSQASFYDNNEKIFMTLNSLEDKFALNEYENFKEEKTNLNIIINDENKTSLDVKVIQYEDENIKLIKYEL